MQYCNLLHEHFVADVFICLNSQVEYVYNEFFNKHFNSVLQSKDAFC